MPMFTRKNIGDATQEVLDHLQLIDNVKALKAGQLELGSAIGLINERLSKIEAALSVAKAEIKLDAIKESQSVVFAVQNSLNQRVEDLAVKLALMGVRGEPRPLKIPGNIEGFSENEPAL